MGKKIVIVLFLMTFMFAINASRNKTYSSDSLNISSESSEDPRLVLEEFKLTRYTEASKKMSLKAKLAYFIEPNILELYGNVSGTRFGEKEEILHADTVMAYFDSESISDLMNQGGLLRAEFEENVSVDFSQHTLRTDYAQYLAEENSLTSMNPVKIDGPKRWFSGSDGFRYEIDKEDLEIYGTTSGELTKNANK
jgi:lipopolysaccharide export system protein LptC